MQNDTGVRLSWGWHPASERMLHIDSVPKGKDSDCVCPDCWDELVAKQGNERAHHFAHASGGQTGEGCLHKSTVWTLYQRIRDAMPREEAVPFQWQCKVCRRKHTTDFVQGATNVYRETFVPGKEIKPDISLYREGNPYCFIEVVDTNPPKEHVRKYARERRIRLVVVKVKENADLNGTIKAEVWEGVVCPAPPDQEALRKSQLAALARQLQSVNNASATIADTHRVDHYRKEDVTDAQGKYDGYRDHEPCTVCGDVMTYTEGGHRLRHSCCTSADRFGMPLCADRNQGTHGHCTKCGARTGLGYGACPRHCTKRN